MSRFSNRTLIVTGGASGIGESTVRRAHAKGASVVIVDADAQGVERLFRTPRRASLALRIGRQRRGQVQACIEPPRPDSAGSTCW